jgi:hypothetical protein
MSRVKWSSAQKAQKKNNKRPFDMAVSDYFAGKNLLRK